MSCKATDAAIATIIAYPYHSLATEFSLSLPRETEREAGWERAGLTCLLQKHQFLSTTALVFRRTNHHTATAPNKIPYTATVLTQTSIKQGVKSYRSLLSGPHPSAFPHNGCEFSLLDVR